MQSPSHGGVGVLPGEQVVHSREDRFNRAGDERAGVEMVVGALDIYGVIFFVLLECWGGGGAVGVSKRRRWGRGGGDQVIERRSRRGCRGSKQSLGLGESLQSSECVYGAREGR